MNKSSHKPTDHPPDRSLKAGQFSIAAILGAMIVIGATLAVFRISRFGGIAFSVVVLPALARTTWAEYLRQRVGADDSRRDFLTMYVLSIAVLMLVSVGSSVAFACGCFVGFLFDPFGNLDLPVRIGLGSALIVHGCLFWISRPRAPHYLP